MKLVKLAAILAAILVVSCPLYGDDVVGTGQIGQVGHQAVFRHIKTWNPASRSYVDCRDQAMLGKANAYAKGLVDSTTKKQAMPSATEKKPHEGGVLPWWLLPLLGWLLLIAILLGLLWALFSGLGNLWNQFLCWIRGLSRPKEKPPEMKKSDITNTAGGQFRGRILPSSRIECFEGTGKLVEIQKAVKDLDGQNQSWKWAPAGGKLDFYHTPGGRLRFLVSFVNWSSREIPTTPSMVIADLFESRNYRPVPGSGRIYIGEREIGQLDDMFLNRLVSREEISLSEIIDKLPARDTSGVGRLNLIYEGDEVDGGDALGGGRVPGEGGGRGEPMFRLHPEPPTEPEAEAEPTTPPPTEPTVEVKPTVEAKPAEEKPPRATAKKAAEPKAAAKKPTEKPDLKSRVMIPED